MAMISYRVLQIKCDGTQAPGGGAWVNFPIIEPGTSVPDVGVLFMSPILRADGASQGVATLRLGGEADQIPLFLLGQNFHITPVDDEGVFFSCPVLAAGTIVILLIGFQLFSSVPQ